MKEPTHSYLPAESKNSQVWLVYQPYQACMHCSYLTHVHQKLSVLHTSSIYFLCLEITSGAICLQSEISKCHQHSHTPLQIQFNLVVMAYKIGLQTQVSMKGLG